MDHDVKMFGSGMFVGVFAAFAILLVASEWHKKDRLFGEKPVECNYSEMSKQMAGSDAVITATFANSVDYKWVVEYTTVPGSPYRANIQRNGETACNALLKIQRELNILKQGAPK